MSSTPLSSSDRDYRRHKPDDDIDYASYESYRGELLRQMDENLGANNNDVGSHVSTSLDPVDHYYEYRPTIRANSAPSKNVSTTNITATADNALSLTQNSTLCQPVSWTLQSFPTCNTIHEFTFDRIQSTAGAPNEDLGFIDQDDYTVTYLGYVLLVVFVFNGEIWNTYARLLVFCDNWTLFRRAPTEKRRYFASGVPLRAYFVSLLRGEWTSIVHDGRLERCRTW